MDAPYPSAPELPGKHTGRYEAEPEPEAPADIPTEEAAAPAPAPSAKPQLIESTKPKPAEEPDEETLADDDEVVTLGDEDELNEHVQEPGDPDGVVADDRIKQWQQTHPLPVAEPKKRKPLWLKALITLVVIAALTVGAWWFGGKKAEAPPTSDATTQTAKTQPKTTTPAATTKHYSSQNFTLEFDYPANWTVSDTATKLTVASPSMQLTSSAGPKVPGTVVLTIQNHQTTIPNYPQQGAAAALASDKITYKKPTQIQRAQTYVSYLGYKDNSLDAVFVTGDNGYQAGQNVPMSDVVKGNPLISVGFLNCGTVGCAAGSTPLSLRPSTWANSPAAKDITALIESLQLD